jgi:predicted membrane protein
MAIQLLGGGLYDVIEARQGSLVTLLPSPTYPQFYYSGMADQTLNESVYFIVFLIMGISGGYISFRSSRYAYRPREAQMLLLIGIALMIVATIGPEAILSWKGL